VCTAGCVHLPPPSTPGTTSQTTGWAARVCGCGLLACGWPCVAQVDFLWDLLGSATGVAGCAAQVLQVMQGGRETCLVKHLSCECCCLGPPVSRVQGGGAAAASRVLGDPPHTGLERAPCCAMIIITIRMIMIMIII
jgi:hypothetical protein